MSTRTRASIWEALRVEGCVVTYSPLARSGVLLIPPDAAIPPREDVLALFEALDGRILRVSVVTIEGTLCDYERAVLLSPAAMVDGPEVIH